MEYVYPYSHSLVTVVYLCHVSHYITYYTGYDNIPASVAKQCIQHYIKPLTYLINSSFECGIFPNELKLAKVIPIFKNGDKQDISNYRPISILSFFSKIFEKTMYNHLINFIDKNKNTI